MKTKASFLYIKLAGTLGLYHKDDYKQLVDKLLDQEQFNKDAYGKGHEGSYTKTELKDMYTRMGNTILNELCVYDSKLKSDKSKLKSDKSLASVGKHISNLKRALRRDFQSTKNIRLHKELEQSIEQNIKTSSHGHTI